MLLLLPSEMLAAPGDVSFSKPANTVEAYDFIEVAATAEHPDAANPFIDASLSGTFQTIDGARSWKVDGFSDSNDGSVLRIRFMPQQPGDYTYNVTYTQGTYQRSSKGEFRVTDGHRRGPIADDPKYPWHFIWSGTGEHYFFNGTTAYWLVGWRDDHVIQYSLERLHRLKVNRLRVTIAGREAVTFFGEPVMTGPNWTLLIAAWPGKNVDDPLHPGFDYTRFNLPYWQKFDRMLKFARDRDMIISLVLDMGDSKVHPEAGGEDEHRFIRYAVNRFAAFSNITWDLGDDLDSYRDEKWTHDTGMLIQELDPYKHLETSHPAVSNAHQDRASSWFGFTSYQEWSRNQHQLMLESRKLQEKTGRIIPQTNEEYGYEDHYPHWAAPGSDSADVLRRTAWDIAMAGAYQTAGETVRRGTNVGADMGGGWMNGRGDDTMTMFLGYGHMVDFFTAFDWWKTNPHDELVNNGNYCLADPGNTYALYLPKGGPVTVQLMPGHYRVFWFSAATGEKLDLPDVEGSSWTSPAPPDGNDWAILLTAR
jgi:Protein of unknown function (DUF4038)/Domain of unknown function (DUF5060)/Putative collagen-binding domain of a collagenase